MRGGQRFPPILPMLQHLLWYALCHIIETFSNSLVKGIINVQKGRGWGGRKMREGVKSGGSRNVGSISPLSVCFFLLFLML
jgi:hypothetical protein